MSYTILAYDDSQTSGLSRFLVDNVSDITTLPIDCKAGSKVTVANTGAEYMLNNQNEWKLQTAGSGSGGGGTWSGAAWGDIAGSIEDQIDLQSALDKKQNTLVSGTNIKTVNGNSLIGSGDITISEEDPVARANIKVIANVTRTTSRDLSVDSLSCDKTYEELTAMINNAGINIPVIKYVHQSIPSSGERDTKYLYLRQINNEVAVEEELPDGSSMMGWGYELVFYELGPSGEYFSILSNNKYSIKNFEPSDHITKGIITYNSETGKYSCSETFYWLGQMIRQTNYTTFIIYENKIYSLLKASSSNNSITSLLFGYLNTTTNKIELFTITDSTITYDEVALGSGSGSMEVIFNFDNETTSKTFEEVCEAIENHIEIYAINSADLENDHEILNKYYLVEYIPTLQMSFQCVNEILTFNEDGTFAINGTSTITRRTMTSSDTNVTLASNTFYTFPEMATLTVTAPNTGLCMLRFRSGSTPTTFTINNATMPDSFSVESNKLYEINIYDGYGVATSWTIS